MSDAGIPLKLLKKLSAARKAVEPVEKRGTNIDKGYSFVEAVDITKEANRVLTGRGIVVLPSLISVDHTYGKTGVLVKAEVEFEVVDTASGEAITKTGVGYGFDNPGDKAIYQAQTGATKYFLAGLLSIPVVGTDPEEDSRTNEAEQIRHDQDVAAEAPDEEPRIKPLPESDIPEPDWRGLALGDEDTATEEEAARV